MGNFNRNRGRDCCPPPRTSYTDRGEVAAIWGAQTNPVFRIYDTQGRMSELRTYKTLAPDTQPTAGTQGFATTTWQYQAQRGFLTAKRDAENKGANYTYTPAGRLETRTWARSSVASPSVTTYTYDAGMLTATNYSDATPDVTQTYDNFGRVTETTNTVSKTTYAYDPASLLLDTETVSHDINTDGTPELTRIIDRSQDNLLRSTGFQLKTGATVENSANYAYSATDGRLSSISNPQLSNVSFAYGYVPDSSLVATVTSPAHTVTNSYDPTRNVLLNKENKAGTTIVSNYAYDVNAIGQRTDVSQSGSAFATSRDIAWGYDPLGQVTKADSTIPGLDRAYQYDLIGNRVKASDSLTLPATPNYTSNSLNQYSAIQNQQSSIINPAYDADGNATAYPLPAQPSANSTLTWDAENRLTSATLPDSTTVTYAYDATSRRIAKTTATGTTLYLYDAWNPIAIWRAGLQPASSPVLQETYLWGMDLSGSMQGAGGVGGLLSVSEISNSQISNYFPTYDGNGNVSEYLDPTGATAAHYEYDPFGNTTVATGPNATAFTKRFSTKPLEAETGLYYYGYRYYDPATGRWPSRDPIGEEGGINLYGFVGNSPTVFIDVLGLRKQTVAKCTSYLFIGHGSKKDPLTFNMKSGCSRAGAVVCFPKTNNPKNPKFRWPGVPTHDERLGAGSVGSKIAKQRGRLGELENDPALGGDSKGIDHPDGAMNFGEAVDNAMASKAKIIEELCKCCDYYRVVIEVGEDDMFKDDIAKATKRHGLKMEKNVFHGHCP